MMPKNMQNMKHVPDIIQKYYVHTERQKQQMACATMFVTPLSGSSARCVCIYSYIYIFTYRKRSIIAM